MIHKDIVDRVRFGSIWLLEWLSFVRSIWILFDSHLYWETSVRRLYTGVSSAEWSLSPMFVESLFNGHSLGVALQVGHGSLEDVSRPSVTQLGPRSLQRPQSFADTPPAASADRGEDRGLHWGHAADTGQTSCRRRGSDADEVTVTGTALLRSAFNVAA